MWSLTGIRHVDLEKHLVVDGGRDQGTNIFIVLRRLFLKTCQQQLKDEFFANLEAGKYKKDDAEVRTDDGKGDGTREESTSKVKARSRLQLKKKADDDPFASDDDDDEEEPKAKISKPPSRVGGVTKKPPSGARTGTKRIREESESGEEEVKSKRRAPLKSKK